MDIKVTVSHGCYLRDRKDRTPYLMSAEKSIDTGDVPDTLPELSQNGGIIFSRSHEQMVLFRYRGHQHHYSEYYVSFMQSIIKIIDVLPDLPSELDVVLARPSYTGQNSRHDSSYGPKQAVFITLQI
ncbi:hypothetical protein GcC1_098010 [Golovinomyces cichoracearum]|uniref:DUF6570 domain-containing protein n=1 Tax=Golovinomyces cichoracearum TaxID=62708 RepID=A0A420IAI2_9PEZI|nr:hypothetical protein GcC1_098010 [Golovinomyces cichoracearum]